MWRNALILVICAVSFADNAPPDDQMQMPAGQDAVQRYKQSCQNARETYYHAVIDADQRDLADLDRAMRFWGIGAVQPKDESNVRLTMHERLSFSLLVFEKYGAVEPSAGPALHFAAFMSFCNCRVRSTNRLIIQIRREIC